MGRIASSIGIITGVPITDTVDQLIAISARPRDLIVSRTASLRAEQTAVSQLTASVLAVQLAGRSLGNAGLFHKTTATTSNSALLTATVTGSPTPANYQVTPLKTAETQQSLSNGFASLDAAVGEGTLVIGRGGFVADPVLLADLNGGSGVSRGKIRITDRSGDSADIDLRYALNIDDVLEAINTSEKINVTAVAEGDAIRLVDNTGATTANLSVAEVSGGSTAADLGLAGINVA
ncbi:MAG: hypothetical protein KDA41_20580, partial [Planctomycetales bacterium]|nr:hypothetical protein [Planctomycetales bacterium]